MQCPPDVPPKLFEPQTRAKNSKEVVSSVVNMKVSAKNSQVTHALTIRKNTRRARRYAGQCHQRMQGLKGRPVSATHPASMLPLI